MTTEREAFEAWDASQAKGLFNSTTDLDIWLAACAWQRERDAAICEEIGDGDPEWTMSVGAVCAAAIRKGST